MTYLYVITDANDDNKKVYSITADNFQDSKNSLLESSFLFYKTLKF